MLLPPRLVAPAFIALIVLSNAAAAAPGDVKLLAPPAPALEFTGYVVDQAGVLSPAERERLTAKLGRFQRDTGHQLAVVTVATLGGEEVATFSRNLANRWGVGRKGINDGIVVLVAPRERKARIAVGYGLERQLPDAFCQEVMDQKMLTAFAQGQIGAGIEAGVSAIIDRLAATSSDLP